MTRPSLHMLTYLAPSLPLACFEHIARHVAAMADVGVSLASETRVSGPPEGEPDPFSLGTADIGFICSPSYTWLRARSPSPVELAAAPVFDDPRAGGRPVYFSDVMVARDAVSTRFDDLAGKVFGFNDRVSRSGYHSLLDRLASVGRTTEWLGGLRETGSHLASLRALVVGEVDAAAIDSNVLRIVQREEPALASRLRLIESWGPYPIQPVVLRAALPREIKRRVIEALLAVPPYPAAGFVRFVPDAR